MEKKEKIIAIIFTWASLFMVVLYSPIVSPDLYSTDNDFVINQSVEFQNGKIKNAPRSSHDYANNSQSSPFETNESEKSYFHNIVIRSGLNDTKQEATDGSMSYPIGNYQNRGTKSAIDEVDIRNSATWMSSKISVLAENNGPVSIAGTQTLFGDVKNDRQKIDYNPNSGASDPGDEPIGNPIPVGDGWLYMLFLALGYAIWKRLVPKLH